MNKKLFFYYLILILIGVLIVVSFRLLKIDITGPITLFIVFVVAPVIRYILKKVMFPKD